MGSNSSSSSRVDVDGVYEILSLCGIDGMTRTNIKSRSGWSYARVRRYLTILLGNRLIHLESNGFYRLTSQGYDLYKLLTKPIATIRRVERSLASGSDLTMELGTSGKHPQPEGIDSIILKVSEVARRLKAHPHSVRRWSDAGVLPSYRIGHRGDRRFRSEDVIAFMRLRGVQPSPASTDHP